VSIDLFPMADFSSNNTPLPIIVASGSHLATLLRLAPSIPTLKVVVSMDSLPPSEWSLLSQWAKSVNVVLKTLKELEEWGAEPSQAVKPGPEQGEREMDIARVITISYTSGTTGESVILRGD
jgi:long-chain acyl-CoA synthetase